MAIMVQFFFVLIATLSLSACDRLGLPDPAKQAAMQEEEGKAIGGACRHSGRALEDCFALHPSALKAAIFTGWKEMNDYMAQNKIETVKTAEESAPASEKKDSAPVAASKSDKASRDAEAADMRARRAKRIAAARASVIEAPPAVVPPPSSPMASKGAK